MAEKMRKFGYKWKQTTYFEMSQQLLSEAIRN